MTQASYASDIGPRDAHTLIAAGAPAVDVREPAEFAAAAIPGSINVPLGQVQLRGLAALREAGVEVDAEHLVLICRSGNRSGVARLALHAALGARGHNLAGGVIGWAQQGLQLTPGGVAAG